MRLRSDSITSSSETILFDELPSLRGSAATPVASDDVVLVRVGEFTGSGATAAGRAESISFDPRTGRIFVTNVPDARIDVARLNADGSTRALAPIELSGLPSFGGVNSVAVKDGVVAVAYQNSVITQPGFVALFDASSGRLRNVIEVGALPDQVTFTPDGKTILVANEGEPANGVDPAGSVSIIDVSRGAANASVVGTVGFETLSVAALKEAGLIFSIAPGLNAIEPEYISVSPDVTRAYVTLQEVNAVAVIDLTDPGRTTPLSIQALGGVDRILPGNAFDPSDRDGIDLDNVDIIGLLQPDAIASFEVGGFTYFITANEGDAGVAEVEARLSTVRLDPTAYPNRATLQGANESGRLNILPNVGDIDGDGDIDQIYAFGGRGISILRQEADGSLTKVRETGGEFEAIIARDFPGLFNIDSGGTAIDNRSDNKGPEPEGVAIGKVGDRIYAFVTLERAGGVIVYDVTDPVNASFVSYKPATAADVAPETVTFVAGRDNATGDDLVLTANEGSGTTTIYRVERQTERNDEIVGGEDAERFDGRGGDDEISGMGGDDLLQGGAGNDLIFGGEGADQIEGGAGNDELWGDGRPRGSDGATDIFLFDDSKATGRDTIRDFGAEDLIVTTRILADPNGDGIIDFGPDRMLDLFGSRNELEVRSDSGGRLRTLEYDGSFVQDGVTYFVYSQVGSAVGVSGAAGELLL